VIEHSQVTKSKYKLTKWHTDKWKNGLKFIKDNIDLLDIGCADCSFFDYVTKYKRINVCGFDVDDSALKIANEKNYQVYNDLNKIKDSFDVITLWEIIEHIPLENFLQYIDWIKLHLKNDGMVLISTPNIENIFYPFWAEPTHIRPYCMNSLVKLLQSQGFEVVYQTKTHCLVHPLKLLFCRFMGVDYYAKLFVVAKLKS